MFTKNDKYESFFRILLQFHCNTLNVMEVAAVFLGPFVLRGAAGDLSRPLLVVASIGSSIINYPELVERERA